MAQQQQQQQSGPPQHHCRDCGLYFDSVTSLDVHLNYHKENLLVKWATQTANNSSNVPSDDTGSTNKSNGSNVKTSRVTTAPADSSDAMIKSEASSGGHPSPFYSGSQSPFQPPQEQQRYSPMFGGPTPPPQQNGGAPPQHAFQQAYSSGFQELRPSSAESSAYFVVPSNTEGGSGYILGPGTDFPSSSSSNSVVTSTPSSSSPSPSSYQQQRYHPYLQYSDNSQRGSNGVGPPGPGPGHHQCDKCGFLCDSSTALVDHLNLAHPPTPRGYQDHMFRFKTEPEESTGTSATSGAEILDLDSHKVHQIYQPDAATLNRHPHSVSSMLWGDKSQQQQFGGVTSTMGPSPSDGIVVPQQQRVVAPSPGYGHLLPPPGTSHQQLLTTSSLSSPKSLQQQQQNNSGGNQTWKSNEARRPKTYNCSACNKWFTSSGHLKRHYNTTLHKNAVKQSGAPDPATQPISNHHHPNRPVAPDQHTNSPSPAGGEDSSTTSPPNMLAGPSVTINNLEAQQPSAAGGLQHFLNSPSSQQHSFNSLQHSQPSSSVHRPPSPQQPHSHHYMLGAAVSPPIHQPTPPAHPTHHLIHHPIPQHHQQLHLPTSPTPPSSIQMSSHHLGEMYSPNGLPPHISMLQSFQQHHQLQAVVPTSTNNHHLITTITGEEIMFQMPSPLQDHSQLGGEQEDQTSQPLPSFSQIGHHLFGGAMANYAATYDLVNSGSTVENVGGLLSSPGINQHHQQDYQHSTSPSNNGYWMESFEEQQHNHQAVQYSPDNTAVQASSESSMGSSEHILSSEGGQECPSSSNGEIERVSTNPAEIELNKEIKQEEVPVISSSVEEPLNKVAHNNNNIIYSMNVVNCNNSRKKPSTKPPTVTNGDVLKCIDCDKVFNKACYLTQHNKSFHSGHKPYKCNRCGKRFPVECMYQEHLGKHAGDKPYKCESCPKQFNHKTDLRRHMCLHTGEKPFACHVCGKGFIRKDHMLKHVETHRRKTTPHHHLASRQVLAAAAQ